MCRRLTILSSVLASTLLAGACGGDSGQALPSVPEGDVPSGDAEQLETETLTRAGEWCVRVGRKALVFVEGNAEFEGRGYDADGEPVLAVNVRHTNNAGTENLTSAAIGTPLDAVGHAIDPDRWANEPADGCHGPYFLVIDAHAPEWLSSDPSYRSSDEADPGE